MTLKMPVAQTSSVSLFYCNESTALAPEHILSKDPFVCYNVISLQCIVCIASQQDRQCSDGVNRVWAVAWTRADHSCSGEIELLHKLHAGVQTQGCILHSNNIACQLSLLKTYV